MVSKRCMRSQLILPPLLYHSFFQQLLVDAQENLKETEISYNKPGRGGTVQICILQHLRKGVAKVVRAAAHPLLIPEVINMEWTDCVNFGLIHASINLLVLTDTTKKMMDRHLRLRKHLYLDRDQTYREMIIHSMCCRVL